MNCPLSQNFFLGGGHPTTHITTKARHIKSQKEGLGSSTPAPPQKKSPGLDIYELCYYINIHNENKNEQFQAN